MNLQVSSVLRVSDSKCKFLKTESHYTALTQEGTKC